MIQRIQSFWLFLGALLNSLILVFDFYKVPLVNGIDNSIKVINHYPSLLLTLVTIILPLVIIFMYKKRKQQISMSIVAIISVSSLLTMLLNRANILTTSTPAVAGGSYWIGAVILPLSMVCFILAIIGIRKDEKLVKSVDRLR